MNSDTLSWIIYLLIGGLLLWMPSLVPPTVPFGVRIPLAYAHDPAVTAERRRYTLRLGILEGGLLLADIAFWSLASWKTLHSLSIFVLVIGGWGIYYLSHRRLAQIKISQGWFANTRQALVASAAPRSKMPSRLFWIFLAFPCSVLLLTAAIGAWRYPALPASLHFAFPNAFGDWTLATTPLNAFLPVIFQGFCTLLFAGLAWARNLGNQPIDVEDPEGSQRYQQLNVGILQALLLLLALGLNGALLAAGLIGWGLLQASGSLLSMLTLAPLAGWLIVAPILLLGLRPNPRAPAQNGGYVNRDDDRFWKLGMFYVNRDDPALMVAKRFGVGRTLNFGHPLTWVIVAALIVFILARLLTRFQG